MLERPVAKQSRVELWLGSGERLGVFMARPVWKGRVLVVSSPRVFHRVQVLLADRLPESYYFVVSGKVQLEGWKVRVQE